MQFAMKPTGMGQGQSPECQWWEKGKSIDVNNFKKSPNDYNNNMGRKTKEDGRHLEQQGDACRRGRTFMAPRVVSVSCVVVVGDSDSPVSETTSAFSSAMVYGADSAALRNEIQQSR